MGVLPSRCPDLASDDALPSNRTEELDAVILKGTPSHCSPSIPVLTNPPTTTQPSPLATTINSTTNPTQAAPPTAFNSSNTFTPVPMAGTSSPSTALHTPLADPGMVPASGYSSTASTPILPSTTRTDSGPNVISVVPSVEANVTHTSNPSSSSRGTPGTADRATSAGVAVGLSIVVISAIIGAIIWCIIRYRRRRRRAVEMDWTPRENQYPPNAHDVNQQESTWGLPEKREDIERNFREEYMRDFGSRVSSSDDGSIVSRSTDSAVGEEGREMHHQDDRASLPAASTSATASGSDTAEVPAPERPLQPQRHPSMMSKRSDGVLRVRNASEMSLEYV